MSALVLLLGVSAVFGAIFLGMFVWAVRAGQMDDTTTPALRVLGEEDPSQSRTQKEES